MRDHLLFFVVCAYILGLAVLGIMAWYVYVLYTV